jgi:outer membrane protein TolC
VARKHSLVSTYEGNPQLNSQRAATRAIDENVPIAPAGYRPRFAGTSSLTEQYLDQLTRGGNDPRTGAVYKRRAAAFAASPRVRSTGSRRVRSRARSPAVAPSTR